MQPSIIIFTNTYPYETGETFLDMELPSLLALKRPIVFVPLYGDGIARTTPVTHEAPITIAPPLLPFPPNNRCKLLFYGLFNCAPVFFGVKEFFVQKHWRSRYRVWRLATSWLLVRAMLSNNRRLFDRLVKDFLPTDPLTLYFYWGDKSVGLLPFLSKKFQKQYRSAPLPKTVVRFHGSDLYEKMRGFHPFRRRIFPLIDAACPVSQYGADHLLARYGAITPPISVARLGTHDYGLGPEPLPETPFHIVTCARIVSLKRLHLIWKALRFLYIKKLLPVPVQWTIIGEGPLRQELEASVKTASLSESLCVHFTGLLPHCSIIDFYRTTPVDLFILTSESEGVPVSIMEAFSFGIPAIATAVGGIPEIVTNGTGYLLPPNPSPKEVAKQLLQFIQLPQEQRNAMRQAARTAWKSEWNAEINFPTFCALL